MSTTNPFTKFLLFFGIFLAVFGISKLDGSNFSFDNNQRAYMMIIGSSISLLIVLVLLKYKKQ